VPELAGHGASAVYQLPVQQQPHANAFRDRHGDDVADVLRMMSEPELGERAGVRRVLDAHRDVHGRLEFLLEVELSPSEVRREHEPALGVHAPRQADAHALAADPRVRAAHDRGSARQLAHELVGIARRRQRCLGPEPGVDARQSDGRRIGPQLHAEDAGAVGVHVQEARTSSTDGAPCRAFRHPAFLDQLIDDGRHRAALEA
jgi:hypothetical protein